MSEHESASSVALPARPCLRRDAAIIQQHRLSVQIAVSARHTVTIPSAPDGLVGWLASLDGSLSAREAMAAAPLPADAASFLLRELDRAGLLFDANTGYPFRSRKEEQRDSLLLARQARDGAVRAQRGEPTRVWIRGAPAWTRPLTAAVTSCAAVATLVQDEAADLMVAIANCGDGSLEDLCDRAAALAMPHLSVEISSMDALLSPLILAGETACRQCWAEADDRVPDWSAWTYRGRAPDPPRLPAHHRALVIALAVEQILIASDVLRGSLDPGRAVWERHLDLRRGTVAVRHLQPQPGCRCMRMEGPARRFADAVGGA